MAELNQIQRGAQVIVSYKWQECECKKYLFGTSIKWSGEKDFQRTCHFTMFDSSITFKRNTGALRSANEIKSDDIIRFLEKTDESFKNMLGK